MSDVIDVGKLTGPVLVFGGTYSNLQATKAIRQKSVELGIPPENCICTGDIIAYCANPVETLREIKAWGARSIQGNCEESLAVLADDCGCGFAEGSQCDVLSKQWFDYAQNALNEDDRHWMGQLPKQMRFQLNGKQFHVVHGGVNDISRFVFASTPISLFLCQLVKAQCDVILGGHCGLPFTKMIGDKVWHNAGVIGMPANDGTPDVWYSLITPMGNDRVEFSHHRLSYDHATAAAAMYECNLAESYAMTLKNGLWPNMDILPEAERAQKGQKLPETVHIL